MKQGIDGYPIIDEKREYFIAGGHDDKFKVISLEIYGINYNFVEKYYKLF